MTKASYVDCGLTLISERSAGVDGEERLEVGGGPLEGEALRPLLLLRGLLRHLLAVLLLHGHARRQRRLVAHRLGVAVLLRLTTTNSIAHGPPRP